MRNLPVALLVAATACGTLAPVPDQNRHYTLSPVPPATAPGRPALNAVGLAPVRFPPCLDRPQIVTRTGPERVEVAAFDRWAAPLDVLFARTLAEDLRDAVPAQEVLTWPWPGGAAVEWTLAVEVLRFEREQDGTAVLDARWVVSRRPGGAAVERGRTVSRVPSRDRQTASSVTALSRSIGDLARDLAAALARAAPGPR